MPDQMTEINRPGQINIADVRRSLAVPERSSPVELHDKVVGRIVNRDCLNVLPDLWEAVNKGTPDLKLLPDSLGSVLSAAANRAGSLELLDSQNPGFSFEEASVISRESTKNATEFEKNGDRIRAAEARRIPTVFVETMVLSKLMGGWGADQLNGKTVGLWRNTYIKAAGDNLNGYAEFANAVDQTDAAAGAGKVIDAFRNLQKLGISSYAQVFEILGMNQEALAKQSEGAIADFNQMKTDLDAKIQELVTQGRIPDVEEIRRSYAAYALAAKELDKGDQDEVASDPEAIFKDMAQKEGIEVPNGSYKIHENSQRSNAAAVMMAWADESGAKETGVALLLPANASKRQICHEGAHGLQGIVIGNEVGSALLTSNLPRPKAELIATYAANKYGGPDAHLARLEAVRFALLSQAQLAGVTALDTACAEGNVEAVAAILKTDLTSPAIEQTFVRPVKGEGRGLPPGAFGLYGSANTAGLEYVRNGTHMKQVIEQAVFS